MCVCVVVAFPPVAVLITVILYLSILCHPISQRIFLPIFPKSEPGQLSYKKLHHCLENREGYHLRNGEMVMMRRNAYFADNLGMNDKCQEHVFFTSVSQYLDIFSCSTHHLFSSTLRCLEPV